MQGKTAFFSTHTAFSPISTNLTQWAPGRPCCFFNNTDTIWKDLLILLHNQSTESTLFCNFCIQNCEVVLFYKTRQVYPLTIVQVAQFDISERNSLGHFLENRLFSLSLCDRRLRTIMRGFRPPGSPDPHRGRPCPLHLQPYA